VFRKPMRGLTYFAKMVRCGVGRFGQVVWYV
jgi:hypothetical protein